MQSLNRAVQPSRGNVLNLAAVRAAAACLAVALAGVNCRTAAPVRAGQSHPPDAVHFGGHWYKVFDEMSSWRDKKARCESMGGYLCCVETEAEQAFVAKLADGRYLSLGASDEAVEDTWVWVNGAPWAYTCWMGGQPNNYGGDEHYLATYDGGEWVDVAVEGSDFWMPTGFICEWGR